MARTRNIKPAFFDNDTLGNLEPLVRLLFIGLWCIADREGRLEDRPRRIKKTLLGYDDVTAEETSGMLQQLADNDFIIRYSVDGVNYIQVTNFCKHQNPNMKEKASEIPPPPHHHTHEPIAEEEECQTDDQGGTLSEEPPDELLEIRFAAFWDAYPKKKSKEAAHRSWLKIHPDAVLFDRIMNALEKQKNSIDWIKEESRYIPYPAKWLDGGCWDDETPGNARPPGTSFATDEFYEASLRRSYATLGNEEKEGLT